MADHALPTPWWRDALERVVWSAVEAGAAVTILDGANVLEVTTWEGAGVAALVAALTVVKTVAASRLGKSDAALPTTNPLVR